MLVTKLDDVLKIAAMHDLARGVAGVDNYNCAGHEPILTAGVDLFLQRSSIQGPSFFFFKVVGQKLTVHESEQSRVEGVLRDGNQNAIVGVPDQSLERGPHAFTSSVGQVDVFGISGNVVTFLNVFGDSVAHMSPAL